MHRRSDPLFCKGVLGETLRSRSIQILHKIDSIDKDQLRATLEDDLIQHVFSEFVIAPLTLHEESKEMQQEETQLDMGGNRRYAIVNDGQPINVPGIRVVVTIPYSRDYFLWRLRPQRYQSVFPHAEVIQPKRDGIGYLDVVIEQPTDAPQNSIKQQLDDELKSIRFYLNSQKSQIEQFNSTMPDSIRGAIVARKERLRALDGVADLLGIPLKRRGEVSPIQPIPIKRALVRPLPPPPESGFKSEPGILDEDYEHILSVIRHVGRTFEVTPKTYAVHDEEELRDIMLAHLNGHYQGGATGETFRRSGKTDIRIEDHDRAAFVAECKVWRGEKELTAAVDQLLHYLTWRDCKASIVVFNKHNAKFTELLSKIPRIISLHPQFKKVLGQRDNGEWRFILSSAEDELRRVIVNVFVFDIYVASDLSV